MASRRQPDHKAENDDINEYVDIMGEDTMVTDEVENVELNTFYESSDDEDLLLNFDEDFDVETPAQATPALRGEDNVRFSNSLAIADDGPTETFTKLMAAVKAQKEKEKNPGNFKDDRPKKSNPFFNPGVSDPGPPDFLQLWDFYDFEENKLPPRPPPSPEDNDFTNSKARFTKYHHLYGKYLLSEKTEIKKGVFECKVVKNPNRILPISRNTAAGQHHTGSLTAPKVIPQNAGGSAQKRVYVTPSIHPSKPPSNMPPMQMQQDPVFRPGTFPKTNRMDRGALAYGNPSRGAYQPRAVPRIIQPLRASHPEPLHCYTRPKTNLSGRSGAPRVVQSAPRGSSAPQQTFKIASYVNGKMVFTEGTREDVERLQRANASRRLNSVNSLAPFPASKTGDSSGTAENQ